MGSKNPPALEPLCFSARHASKNPGFVLRPLSPIWHRLVGRCLVLAALSSATSPKRRSARVRFASWRGPCCCHCADMYRFVLLSVIISVGLRWCVIVPVFATSRQPSDPTEHPGRRQALRAAASPRHRGRRRGRRRCGRGSRRCPIV